MRDNAPEDAGEADGAPELSLCLLWLKDCWCGWGKTVEVENKSWLMKINICGYSPNIPSVGYKASRSKSAWIMSKRVYCNAVHFWINTHILHDVSIMLLIWFSSIKLSACFQLWQWNPTLSKDKHLPALGPKRHVTDGKWGRAPKSFPFPQRAQLGFLFSHTSPWLALVSRQPRVQEEGKPDFIPGRGVGDRSSSKPLPTYTTLWSYDSGGPGSARCSFGHVHQRAAVLPLLHGQWLTLAKEEVRRDLGSQLTAWCSLRWEPSLSAYATAFDKWELICCHPDSPGEWGKRRNCVQALVPVCLSPFQQPLADIQDSQRYWDSTAFQKYGSG